MNPVDRTYHDLLKLVLGKGRKKSNRTGINTIGVFGAQAKFDLSEGFPVLTTKKIFLRGVIHELLWFLSGSTNIKYLVDKDVHIWDEWAYARYTKAQVWGLDDADFEPPDTISLFSQEKFIHHIKGSNEFAEKWGELGDGTYGGMWRKFPYEKQINEFSNHCEMFHVDQIQKVINTLKSNPDDRRMIVSAWHPYWVDHCALPPCHCLFHFNTEELTRDEKIQWLISKGIIYHVYDANDDDFELYKVPKRRLNCLLYQRSCDLFLGVPFNITSYSLLTAMVAHCVGMEPGIFTHTYGDLHIYENHMEQVKTQMQRTSFGLPTLVLNDKKRDIFDFKFEDIQLTGYQSHPPIPAPIAV